MNNFKLLLESVHQLLLEKVNYKPLHQIWQEVYLNCEKEKHSDIISYDDLTAQKKQELKEYIQRAQESFEDDLNSIEDIDDNEKQWMVKIFSTKQQDIITDLEKVIEQLEKYNDLKRRDKISKEDKNINNLTYFNLLNIINRFKDELDAEQDFGNNKIIHEDGDWKIIKFENHKDTAKYIKGSKSNWCIKWQRQFDAYKPPYYAFYKHNKPYALFHEASIQLKDVDDQLFKTIDDDFKKQIIWFLDEMKFEKFKKYGDFGMIFKPNFDEFIKHFDASALLVTACDHADVELVKKLLNVPNINVNYSNGRHTPLGRSILWAQESGITDLLLNHPDIDVNKAASYNSNTPLIHSIKAERFELFKKLLERPDIEVNTVGGEKSPILEAMTMDSSSKYFDMLVKHPKLDINADISDGEYSNVLEFAIAHHMYSEVEKIVAHPDIDINYRDDSGKTHLIRACEKENVSSAAILLKHPKIDINAHTGLHKTTALQWAALNGMELTVKRLLAFPNININAQDAYDNTALICAVMDSPQDSSRLNCIKSLLEHPRINTKLKNVDGRTALAKVEAMGRKEYVELLKSHGVTE